MDTNTTDISEGINEINVTPFVDVVLVLLVIFMVTAPVMIKDSLKVNLPKTLTTDLPVKVDSIGIAITKEGQIFFNGLLMGEQALAEELKRRSQVAADTHFLISADVESRHGDLIKMIDLLKRNNLNKFALQVEKKQKNVE